LVEIAITGPAFDAATAVTCATIGRLLEAAWSRPVSGVRVEAHHGGGAEGREPSSVDLPGDYASDVLCAILLAMFNRSRRAFPELGPGVANSHIVARGGENGREEFRPHSPISGSSGDSGSFRSRR